MTALATTTRLALVTVLEATGRKVYPVAPAVPVPPCLAVVPDQQWIVPNRVGSNQRYELRLKVMCVARDNAEGVTECEEAVEAVMAAVADMALVTNVTPPASLDVGAQGTVLASEVHLSIHVKE